MESRIGLAIGFFLVGLWLTSCGGNSSSNGDKRVDLAGRYITVKGAGNSAEEATEVRTILKSDIKILEK